MKTVRRLVIGFMVALFVSAASTRGVLAHPAATTSLILTIANGSTFDLAVNADADGLIAKLAALDRAGSSAPASAASDRHARLVALQRVLRDHIDIRAEDSTLLLVPSKVTTDAATGQAIVTFTGRLPPNAASLVVRARFIYGSYALVVRHAGVEGESVEWIQAIAPSKPYSIRSAAPTSFARAAIRACALGFTHIVPNGLDHILFVIGLFLLNARLRPILIQVSAFTLAHSITLGLTLFGLVSVPASIVEPLIALSIVYVACENLVTSTLKPWRVALVFGFGLLHGMGFAEALTHLNLARADFLTTLIGFNVGVEAGQLSVIAAVALAMHALTVWTPRQRVWIARPASIAIALTGAIWVVERLI